MRYCAKCGARVSDEDRFCLRCGEPLDASGKDADAAADRPDADTGRNVDRSDETCEEERAEHGEAVAAIPSDLCCRYGFYAIGLGILAGILVMIAFAYQSTATVDLEAGGLHLGVSSGNDTLSLLDIGFGGLGCEYYIPTFVVLFFAVLSLYSPVFGSAGSVSGLVVATYLNSIVFTGDGVASDMLPGLDNLGSGVSATLELDDIGFVYLLLLVALVMSIVGYLFLRRASVLSSTEGLFETQAKAWRNRF